MSRWTIGRRIAAGYAVLILLLLATAIVAVLALRSHASGLHRGAAHDRGAAR